MNNENEIGPSRCPGAYGGCSTANSQPARQWNDRLLLRMNHETRSAVNTILGQMELLLDSQLTPEQAARANTVRACADHLLAESAEILDLARMESGSLLLKHVRFDPREALRQALAMLSILARRDGISLRIHIPDDLPEALVGDPERIGQMVVTLVRNGMERIGKGEISVRVEHYPGSAEDATIKFSVFDSGPPMPPVIMGHLFDGSGLPGSTIESNPKLGLSFSKRLAEMMGGTMWVGEGPNSGTALHFNVKLVLAPPEEFREGGRRSATEPRVQARPLKILLAEDCADNVRLIQAFIKDEPWSVDTAANGRIALERAAASIYDLILMDLDMPEMDGYAAARRIRISECRGETPIVPIVALSAHNEAEAALKSLEAGCTAHVTKPIGKNALIRTIRQYAYS